MKLFETEVYMKLSIGNQITTGWMLFDEDAVLNLQEYMNATQRTPTYTIQSGAKQIINIPAAVLSNNCLIIDTKNVYILFGLIKIG